MLVRSGVQNQVKSLLGQGKKFASCVQSCMDKKSGNCAKKLGCGLDLPGDAAVIQTAKQCAINSGLNTQTIQQLCNCAVGAGVKQLNGVCNQLIIS